MVGGRFCTHPPHMLIRKNYKTKKNAKGLEITGATMGATYQITGTPHDLVEEQRQEQKSYEQKNRRAEAEASLTPGRVKAGA